LAFFHVQWQAIQIENVRGVGERKPEEAEAEEEEES